MRKDTTYQHAIHTVIERKVNKKKKKRKTKLWKNNELVRNKIEKKTFHFNYD